jgi:hypothetical protein
MRYPGEVWFLPRDAREEGDSKGRRHVLLTDCGEVDDCGVLAYASRQAQEARHGAAYVLIDPFMTAYGKKGRTGFDQATHIYPCRLVGASSEEMDRCVGRIIDELPAIRSELHVALGLKTGSSSGVGVAAGSWRGRIITLDRGLAAEMDCERCLIVTEPSYSLRQRYQLVIPVLDSNHFEEEPLDTIVEGYPWIGEVLPGADRALLATSAIQTAFHPSEITAWTGVVVDELVMAEVDLALLSLFGL